MASSRSVGILRGALFDIFIQIPSLVMAEFAGCIRCMFIAVMIGGLIAIVAAQSAST